jgi:hypothetical protein
MRLRKLVIATHRDVGYLLAGMTVIYAISGVAVNHVDDWNPNYVLRTETTEVGRLADGSRHQIAAEVLARMAVDERPREVVRMSSGELRIFLEGRTLTVALPEGVVQDEVYRRRFVFFETNYLHLNHGKGVWTWIADAYAVGLALLACTGIFIITGKKGLGGRGRVLLIIGLAIPILYLVIKL